MHGSLKSEDNRCSAFADRGPQTPTERERCFCKSHYSVELLNSLADSVTEIHFGREQTELANAPDTIKFCLAATVTVFNATMSHVL